MYALITLLLVTLPLLGAAGQAGTQPRRKALLLNACAGDQTTVSYWATALKAPDPRRRVQAATTLGESRTKAAVPPLIDAVKDEIEEVRLAAIRALGRIGRDANAAIPALTAALNDKDPAIRSEAATALARIRRGP